MNCDQALEVQAYFDGELDAMAATAVEKHLETCAECASLRKELETLRADIGKGASYYRASLALERRVQAAIGGSDPAPRTTQSRRPFWLGAASGAGAMALAASLAVGVMLPVTQDQLAQDTVSAHVRSLMDNHLIDVASSNHHVVKPWFAGRADVSPPADDFSKDGFALAGGRMDYVHGERAAVLVYRHGAHVANVFVWRDDGKSRTGDKTVNGYHVLAWKKGDLFFSAVSDMAPDELAKLAKLMRENSSD